MVKIYKQPFAHDGDTIAIPDASQPDGKISNSDGWTPDYQLPKTDPNYKPVGRQEMNGVFKEVTESLGEIQQFGFAKWQPITWPQGARVVEGGVVYRALNQTSQQPPHADWADDSAIGVDQTWQAMTGSRLPNTNYTNTTGRTIMVAITFGDSGEGTGEIRVGGLSLLWGGFAGVASGVTVEYPGTVLVPAGAEYSAHIGANQSIERWVELR